MDHPELLAILEESRPRDDPRATAELIDHTILERSSGTLEWWNVWMVPSFSVHLMDGKYVVLGEHTGREVEEPDLASAIRQKIALDRMRGGTDEYVQAVR